MELTSRFPDYELLTEEKHKEDPNFIYAVLSEDHSSYEITNLEPNTNYAVAVNMVAYYGTMMNNPYHCRIQTQPGIPSEPVAVNVQDITGSSIRLAFLPPKIPRGEITNYIIETTLVGDSYCLDETRLDQLKVQCLPRYTLITAEPSGQGGQIETTLPGLQTQADYDVRVKALTKSTEGEWADAKRTKTSSRLTENEPDPPEEKICKF